jgi:hypothetical protein
MFCFNILIFDARRVLMMSSTAFLAPGYSYGALPSEDYLLLFGGSLFDRCGYHDFPPSVFGLFDLELKTVKEYEFDAGVSHSLLADWDSGFVYYPMSSNLMRFRLGTSLSELFVTTEQILVDEEFAADNMRIVGIPEKEKTLEMLLKPDFSDLLFVDNKEGKLYAFVSAPDQKQYIASICLSSGKLKVFDFPEAFTGFSSSSEKRLFVNAHHSVGPATYRIENDELLLDNTYPRSWFTWRKEYFFESDITPDGQKVVLCGNNGTMIWHPDKRKKKRLCSFGAAASWNVHQDLLYIMKGDEQLWCSYSGRPPELVASIVESERDIIPKTWGSFNKPVSSPCGRYACFLLMCKSNPERALFSPDYFSSKSLTCIIDHELKRVFSTEFPRWSNMLWIPKKHFNRGE